MLDTVPCQFLPNFCQSAMIIRRNLWPFCERARSLFRSVTRQAKSDGEITVKKLARLIQSGSRMFSLRESQQLLPFRWRRANSLLRVPAASEFRKIHKNYARQNYRGVIVTARLMARQSDFLRATRRSAARDPKTLTPARSFYPRFRSACARAELAIAFYEPPQSRDCT